MAGQIQHMVLVGSGKGGVGKSTVSSSLAVALQRLGHSVGLLDADIYGPSIPTMLGPAAKPISEDGKRIAPVQKFGLKLMSMGYLVDPNTAMVWRGPMLAGAVTQLVNDVDWGMLDYLVLDLPPGTGDIQLSLAQKFKVDGAVLVTTPQDVALADVVRAKAMFDRVRVHCLGLVENMSYFVCGKCAERHEIFSHGSGERTCAALGVPFLGRIPLEISVRTAGDSGTPVQQHAPHSDAARAFMDIAARLHEGVVAQVAARERAQIGRRALPIVRS